MNFRSVVVARSWEQVVEQIYEAVRSGELSPGERLPTERELGESFGVSRTVVREALKVLTSMGLVESKQGSGNYISSNPTASISRALTLSATPDARSMMALFEVREPLEALSARLAAERRTPEQAAAIVAAAEESRDAALTDDTERYGRADYQVHSRIAEASGNPYIGVMSAAMMEVLSVVLMLTVSVAGRREEAAEHHIRIADAIARGDPDLAAEYMAEHIRYTARSAGEISDQGHAILLGPNSAIWKGSR